MKLYVQLSMLLVGFFLYVVVEIHHLHKLRKQKAKEKKAAEAAKQQKMQESQEPEETDDEKDDIDDEIIVTHLWEVSICIQYSTDYLLMPPFNPKQTSSL